MKKPRKENPRWGNMRSLWRYYSNKPAPKVKAEQKNPSRRVQVRTVCVTTKDTDEAHRLIRTMADQVVEESAANKAGRFRYTTKNKFRAYRNQLNRLSPADRREVTSQHLLQY